MQPLIIPQELTDLPANRLGPHRSFEDLLDDLAKSDRILQAAEAATASAFAIWTIFPGINVDDDLIRAYETAYPGLALDSSLYEHYLRVAETGDASLTGFISGLKGKLAEFHAKDILEQNGYTDVEIAASATQSVWDISAVDNAGETVTFQVKTGAEGYASAVRETIESNPDIEFLVSSEIYANISDSSPQYVDRLTDIGEDYAHIEGIDEGLDTLRANMGMDLPDGIAEALPAAAAALAAARLIYGAWSTEQGFKAADRTAKNKLHVVSILTILSRLAVAGGSATALGTVGTAAGSLFPGPGNIVGGIGGALGGAGLGMYLNNISRSRMLELALDIAGLTYDDLFYYKNKTHIDDVAVRFHDTAKRLTATDWRTAPN